MLKGQLRDDHPADVEGQFREDCRTPPRVSMSM